MFIRKMIVKTMCTRVCMCFIIFRVRRSRCEMYIGHGRLCVCLSMSLAAFPQYCTDPDVTWRNGSGYLLVVQYWTESTDLQSVHGVCCYDNTHVCNRLYNIIHCKCVWRGTRNVSECLIVLALWLVFKSTAVVTDMI